MNITKGQYRLYFWSFALDTSTSLTSLTSNSSNTGVANKNTGSAIATISSLEPDTAITTAATNTSISKLTVEGTGSTGTAISSKAKAGSAAIATISTEPTDAGVAIKKPNSTVSTGSATALVKDQPSLASVTTASTDASISKVTVEVTASAVTSGAAVTNVERVATSATFPTKSSVPKVSDQGSDSAGATISAVAKSKSAGTPISSNAAHSARPNQSTIPSSSSLSTLFDGRNNGGVGGVKAKSDCDGKLHGGDARGCKVIRFEYRLERNRETSCCRMLQDVAGWHWSKQISFRSLALRFLNGFGTAERGTFHK
eukprot:gb/GEZJ01000172.1/.p1 GENE.gb/GEZJ01000172.1/~~gb/GEZJ01000172.1/.p1  ORF type:complete len:314 (-),score=51.01 gb/GEZJ01000172.1/:386-1327(-)